MLKHGLRNSCAPLAQRQWVHLILIILIGIAIYSNTLHVPFVLDDIHTIQSFASSNIWGVLIKGGSRRIADITFVINYKLHGTQLPGYHITNLVIHLAAATTLYYLIKTAICSLAGIQQNCKPFSLRYIPLAVALLFVTHPLQTQAVTYTVQRYTSLAALFYIFSALAFTRLRMAIENQLPIGRVWMWATATLVSGLLAFGSKQIAATLPIMLVVMEYVLFNGRYLTRRFYIACASLLLAVSAFFMYQWLNGTLEYFLYDLRHATSDDQFMPRTTYFITQLRVVVTYLRLLVLPVDQNLFYDYPIYKSLLSASLLSSLALHLFLGGIAIYMLRLSRRTAASQCNQETTICLRLAALGIVWFYLTLAVESSIVPIRDVIFEHRVYLPSAGIFLAVCALTALAAGNRRYGKQAAWTTLFACCLILGIATFTRNQVWGDAVTIWQDTAQKSPNNGLVLSSLAAEYSKRGQVEKALPLYVRAIELRPSLDFRVKAGLGAAMKAMKLFDGRFTTGHEYILPDGRFNNAALYNGRFSHWEGVISNNMALAYEYFGQSTKAWDAYQNAILLSPDYDLAWYNVGLFGAREGDWGKVITAIARLKVINPAMAATLEKNLRQNP